ncbi:antibiotic biosynthesis monooxygenase family protein [Pseudoalteromonas piscicida]|uniref:antibiotic biosynthesis monooxygenase family protein n=1 Tax=Pseudoalteromonas piscicida TaxID=43662 RepID=UPI0027E509C0|nr:antibiotic biosynthesis monooxygenase family protein [Pseudoalteromonas piscicida]WMO16114.1 antibiotic biosynthesis monooxygenase [Pseudoalteromonas piscicida]
MVIEIARFQVEPNVQEKFFESFTKVRVYLEKAEGYLSHVISQEIENPSCICLMVEWRSYEDHVEIFEPSGEHDIFLNALMPFVNRQPEVLHYSTLSTAV